MYTVTVQVRKLGEWTCDHLWSHRTYRDAAQDAKEALSAYYDSVVLNEFDQETLDRLVLARWDTATYGPVQQNVYVGGQEVLVTLDRTPAYASYPRAWKVVA